KCVTCHPTPRSSFATWGKGCVQGGCHPAGTPQEMHGGATTAHAPAATNTECFASGCHRATDVSTIHASAETTVNGQARTSCMVCHDSATLTKDCSTCHTAAGVDYHLNTATAHASRTIVSCFANGCHPASRNLVDVHAIYVGPGSANSQYATTCELCHKNTNADRINWTTATASCVSCHPVYHGRAQGAPVIHGDRDSAHTYSAASSGCTGCHSGSLPAIHKAIDTVASDCVSCHRTHASLDTGCGLCHASNDTWSKTAECASCHQADPHPNLDASHTAAPPAATITISGVDYPAQQCTDCHPSMVISTLHTGDCMSCHPEEKASLTPSWNKGCAQGDCHTVGSARPMHDTVDAAHAPAAGLTCFNDGCHDTVAGQSFAGIHAEATTTVNGSTVASCAVCHAAGKPQGATCEDPGCHGDVLAMHESGSHGTTETVSACLGNCHEPDLQAEHARSTGARTPVGCSTCHSAFASVVSGTWDGTCYACHTPQHSDMSQSGNGRCLECHGDSAATISAVATAGAYANTAGDHSAGYDVSAHGAAVSAGNDAGASTGVQCEACHSHKAGNDALTDYRTAGLTAADGSYSGLCYRCHSSESTETVSVGSAPYSWNGRDVKAEFARASSHPVFASAPATASVDDTIPVFSQSNQAEFASSSYSMTTNLLGGGPQLFWGTVLMAPRANQNMMLMTDSAGTNQYDRDAHAGLSSWNDDGYNPPDMPAGKEPMASVVADDRLVVLTGGATQELWEYALPTASSAGAWTKVSTLPTGGGTFANTVGADMAYDSTRDLVYVIPGSGSSSIFVWDPATQTRLDRSVTETDGAPIALGQGSMIAYSQDPDALWIVRSVDSASTNQGYLYKVALSPGWAEHPDDQFVAVNSGLRVARWQWREDNGNAYEYQPANYKMTRYRKDGVDTLLLLSACADHSYSATVWVRNLTTTPTQSWAHQYPWGPSTSPNNGHYLKRADIEWDGGNFVYATETYIPDYYNWGTVAAIPACIKRFNITTSQWEPVTPYTGFNGGILGFASATPPAGVSGTGYAMAGTVVSPEITPMADAVAWGRVNYAATVPSGTAVSVKVQGKSGESWTDVPGFESVLDGDQLTGVGVHDYDALRLVATLSTTDQTYLTPQLKSWSISAAHPMIAEPATDTQIAKADRGGAITWTDVHDATATVGQAIQIPVSAQPGWNRKIMLTTNRSGWYLAYDPASGVWDPWSYRGFSGSTLVTGSAAFTSADNKAYFTVPPGLSGDLSMLKLGPLTSDRIAKEGTGTADTLGIQPTGGDAAYDTTRNVAYVAQASLEPTTGTYKWNRIWRWKPGVGPMDPMPMSENSWRPSNAMAYAPKADRLFLWMTGYATGTTVRLNYVDAPATATTATIVNASPKIYGTASTPASVGWATGSNYNTKLAVFEVNGQEYMASFGGGSALDIWGNLSAAPGSITRRGNDAGAPSSFGAQPVLTSGGELKWDGGEYLYATYGKSSPAKFGRIKIPANPMSDNWPMWENLTGYYLAGGPMTFVRASGLQVWQTLYTPEIVATARERAWQSVSYTASVPTSSTLYGTLEGFNGTAWTSISTEGYFTPNSTYTFTTPMSTVTYPKLRIRFAMSCMDGQGSPVVTGWTVKGGYGESTWVTNQALPSPGSTSWESAYHTSSQPIGTSMKLTLQGWNGTEFVDIPGYVDRTDSMLDIRDLSIRQWPRLRLRGSYTTATYGTNPSLDNWWITSSKQSVQYASSLSCASCHNAHVVQTGGGGAWDTARVSDPTGARGTFSESNSTEMTQFCLKCHGSSQVVRAVDAATNVPYTIAFSSPSGPYFTSWLKGVGNTAFGLSGHQTTGGTKAGCETCHDPHGSDNAALNAWTRPSDFTTGVPGVRDNSVAAASEENLCFQCHGNGTLGVQAPGAADVASSITATYGHTATRERGKHSDSESAVDLGVPNRHSECVDCHDPHSAQPGTHVAGGSQVSGALIGATGVKPIWPSINGTTATSYEPMRITGAATDAEAYVCFKCHTNNTLMTAQATSSGIAPTDLAYEFNPANASFHNVLGLPGGVKTTYTINGKTDYWSFYNTLKAPWTASSPVSCSDCHASSVVGQAKGPHGSSVKFMIDPNYPDPWAAATLDPNTATGVSGTIICSKCHTLMGTNDNPIHTAGGISATRVHSNWSMGCNACHIAIPHGWKRPRLLGSSTDPAPYRTGTHNTRTALIKLAIRERPDRTWRQGDCEVGCSSTHRGYAAPTNYWP
ncbi:MAG: hypothetical protein HGB10_11410, partial [Coriobacteriia bacterium]|nr:hypothetical protein [Coriobacteriia bacterium]